ncbi:MAG: O-unit flippase Wzx [Myxococcales bacterium]
METTTPLESATLPSAPSVREAPLAIWNALMLGSSLVLTWGVSLGIRALLPRYLGPERFGAYSFAEAVAPTFFVFCSLGVETYVQKEIPVRHEHATEFFGGILAIRLLLSAVLLTLMCVALRFTGRTPEIVLAAFLFGIGQVFFVHNATFVAMLNARGTVGGMSVVNVLAKVSWGACILAAVLLRLDLWALAASFAVSEAVRSAVLFHLCRRHLALRIALHLPHLRAALVRSAPFFVTGLALTLFARFDVMILSYLADPLELGWYSAASQVSHLGLLLVPLISGVCLPMFSRARRRSEDELSVAIRRSLEIILMVAIPVSLALFVGADVWIRMLGGAGFEPASRSLRAIAPIFILTYVAILSSSCLNLINRAWTVTRVCLIGIGVNATLNVVLIRHLGPRLGLGGAGVGAGLAAVITEALVCAMLLSVIGRRVIDARLLRVVLLTALTCAGVIAVDHLLRPLGPARLLVDGAAYAGLALLTGAVRWDDLQTLAAQLRARPSP